MTTTTSPLVGQRSTKQKRALAALLQDSETFLSAQDVHASLVAGGEHVGLTTVYSQLRALADAGVIDVVHNEEGEALYRRCSTTGQHDHLRCLDCGFVAEIDNHELQKWLRKISRLTRFQGLHYTLELTGTCDQCQTLSPSNRAGSGNLP